MFTSNIAITRDKVILGDFKNALKNKIIKNNNNNNNELQSSCHCFETRVNTVYKYQEKEGKSSSVGDWGNA